MAKETLTELLTGVVIDGNRIDKNNLRFIHDHSCIRLLSYKHYDFFLMVENQLDDLRKTMSECGKSLLDINDRTPTLTSRRFYTEDSLAIADRPFDLRFLDDTGQNKERTI